MVPPSNYVVFKLTDDKFVFKKTASGDALEDKPSKRTSLYLTFLQHLGTQAFLEILAVGTFLGGTQPRGLLPRTPSGATAGGKES